MNNRDKYLNQVWETRRLRLMELAKTETMKDIAKAFGVSERTASRRCAIMGVRVCGYFWDGLVDQVREYAKTMSVGEIAAKFGKSYESTSSMLRRNKIRAVRDNTMAKERGYINAREHKAIVAEMCKTMTVREIAERFGQQNDYVRNFCHRQGLTPKKENIISGKYWETKREEVETLAKTKARAQLAKHFGVTDSQMRNGLKALGIIPTVRRSPSPKSALKPVRNPKPIKPKAPVNVKKMLEKKAYVPQQERRYVVSFGDVKVQKIESGRLDDLRNVMARPVYVPGAKTISVRY